MKTVFFQKTNALFALYCLTGLAVEFQNAKLFIFKHFDHLYYCAYPDASSVVIFKHEDSYNFFYFLFFLTVTQPDLVSSSVFPSLLPSGIFKT